MSEQLQGRALDEAVAKILGTIVARQWMAEWDGKTVAFITSANGYWTESKCPAYSTDPVALTEMLEWLREHRDADGKPDLSRLMIQWHHSNRADNSLVWGFQASVCRDGAWFAAFGATINEALARLVLAVAGRDAK